MKHTKTWTCACGITHEVSTLHVYAKCPKCKGQMKLRSFGGDIDKEDLILIVMQWLTEAGIDFPEPYKSLIDTDWDDWDEYFSD